MKVFVRDFLEWGVPIEEWVKWRLDRIPYVRHCMNSRRDHARTLAEWADRHPKSNVQPVVMLNK